MQENDRLTGTGHAVVHPDVIHLGSAAGNR